MAILSIWQQCVQQWAEIKSGIDTEYCDGNSNGRSGRSSNKHTDLRRSRKRKLHDNKSRSSFPVHSNLFGSGNDKPDRNPEGNRGYKRNGYYKYLYPVIGLLIASPVNAENVGGISATANPIANSSGSVTNQAIQVLQGPYITNTYGNGISCQGPTLNVTPFITRGYSTQDPFERRYFEPQYDMRDFIGRTIQVEKNVKNYPWEPWYDDRTKTDGTRWFEDGADMTITIDEIVGDGVPDNPGEVVWQKPVRTGQQDNISTNIGLSATISFPLDGGLQARCKKAADTNTALQAQLLANKRLDFEIARLKNCGELLKSGIRFHPRSPYAAICADVVVNNVTHVKPHRHTIPPISSAVEPTSTSSQPRSSDAAQLGAPLSTVPGSSFPVKSRPSLGPSSQSVSPLLTKDQQEALRAGQMSSQLQQSKQ